MTEYIVIVLKKYKDCPSKVLDIITESLKYLYTVDEKHFYEYCETLCDLKDNNPNFIILYNEKTENSLFNQNEDCIILNQNGLNIQTFFHEITHAMHFYNMNAYCPEDLFSHIIQDESNYIFIINYLNKKLDKDFILDKTDISEQIPDDSIINKFHVYKQVKGIIDSITKGISRDFGIHCSENNDYLYQKTKPDTGHGINYFSKQNAFIEILAEYAAIRNSEFKDEMFKLLSLVIDINFLEKYYKALFTNSYKFELNENNNIKK